LFQKKVLATLLKENEQFFNDLVKVKNSLNARFYDVEQEIRCLMIAVASGETMLLIGPPGTAKSRLIRAFANLAGLIEDTELTPEQAPPTGAKQTKLQPLHRLPGYFEYLLTPFTEPNELFGYFDIGKLMGKGGDSGGTLQRIDTNMMQYAQVVFLDEVFNASSAILNSLLTFVNERKFHDRGESYEVNLSCLFGATNFPPKRAELIAIYDRFLLRSWVDNASSEPAPLSKLLQSGWRETNAATTGERFENLLSGAARFRAGIARLSKDGKLAIDPSDTEVARLTGYLASLVKHARQRDFSLMSNRRLVRFTKIFLVSALLDAAEKGNGAPAIDPVRDLMLLPRFGMDKPVSPNELLGFQGLLVGAAGA
jgi:MoxR-like ATPase